MATMVPPSASRPHDSVNLPSQASKSSVKSPETPAKSSKSTNKGGAALAAKEKPKTPELYIASYSGVDVYETNVNDFSLMRRCEDDWVNSTQILKAAQFPKAQRTRILEKEIQTGIHQKIQGGNGRFQGTWVPLQIAINLAKNHGLLEKLSIILNYVPDSSKPLIRLKSSTKANSVPSKRKKLNNGNHESTPSKQSSNNSGIASSSKKKTPVPLNVGSNYSSPHNPLPPPSHPPTPSNLQYQPQRISGPVMQTINYAQPNFVTYAQPGSNPPSATNPHFGQFPQQLLTPSHPQFHKQLIQPQPYQHVPHPHPPPSSLPRPIQQQPQQVILQQTPSLPSQSSMISDEKSSEVEKQHYQKPDQSQSSYESEKESHWEEDNPYLNHEDSSFYSKKLIDYFSEGIEDNIPGFILSSVPSANFKIDAPIDIEGHSPLHWAAAMGNLKLVSILISKHANPLVQNSLGLNPLSRLVTFNNCYEKKNFPQILQCLKSSLYKPDRNNRLIIHYLCQFASIPTKLKSIHYYFDIVFEEVMKSNDFCFQQMIKLQTDEFLQKHPGKSAKDFIIPESTLKRGKTNFLQIIINHRDVDGDTPLHLAARSKDHDLIMKVIGFAADFAIINENGESPFDLLCEIKFPWNDVISKLSIEQQQQVNQLQIEQQQEIHKIERQQLNNSNIMTPIYQKPKNSVSRFQTPSQLNFKNDSNKENLSIKTPDILQRASAAAAAAAAAAGSTTTQRLLERTSRWLQEEKDGNNTTNYSIISPLRKINFDETTNDEESIFQLNSKEIMSPSKRYFDSSNEFGSSSVKFSTPLKSKGHRRQLSKNTLLMNEISTINSGSNANGAIAPNNNLVNNEGFLNLKQKYFDIFNEFESSYSKDLACWNNEYKETVDYINRVGSDLVGTDNNIRAKLTSIFDVANNADSESLKNILAEDCEYTKMKGELEKKLENTENSLFEKTDWLMKLIERSQAKLIADLVVSEENEIDDSEVIANNNRDDPETLLLLQELTQLQLSRQLRVQNLINEIFEYTVSRKMNNYRKLIGISCGLKLDAIDDLIDGIEQALVANASNDTNANGGEIGTTSNVEPN